MNCSSFTTIVIRMNRKNRYRPKGFIPIMYNKFLASRVNSKVLINNRSGRTTQIEMIEKIYTFVCLILHRIFVSVYKVILI